MKRRSRPAAGRPVAAAPRREEAPRLRFALDATEDGEVARGWGVAGWAVIAAYAGVLLWVAFRLHVVGDYSTESDFYGGYAEGARLIQQGRWDAARYPVVGPGYEAALALFGLVFRDLFTAARVISVASAVAIFCAWRAILVRRADARLAFAFLLLFSVNEVFLRYAVSATTDVLAVALQAAALAMILASRSALAPVGAGALAALATLTRYNAVALVPAGIACYLGLAPPERGSGRRATLFFLAGFAAIVGPWTAWSLSQGHVPGASLFNMFSSFYVVDDASRNVQDQTPAMADSIRALRESARSAGGGVLGSVVRVLLRVPEHLVQDARQLLGLPVAALALAGFAFAWLDGSLRRLAPMLVAGGCLFLSLAPVFYSDRYSLAVLPAYVVLAAAGASSRSFAFRISPPGVNLKWIAVAAVLALSLKVTVAEERRILGNQPVEVLAAGETLARLAAPGDRVISRKAHIGYYSGLRTVPFPRLEGLRDLAAVAREQHARWLYFSWYEALIRPEFAYLLDTTAFVPGLERVFSASINPVAVYRIGDGFGAAPTWASRRDSLDLHLSRAMVRYMPPDRAVEARIVLATDAITHENPEAALEHLARAAEGGPIRPAALRLSGHAFYLMGELEEAANAYQRALAAEPGDFDSRANLGWVRLALGDTAGAARDWRPIIGPALDSETLSAMIRIYERLGDLEAAENAARELTARTQSR